jgi:hypothetical protein
MSDKAAATTRSLLSAAADRAGRFNRLREFTPCLSGCRRGPIGRIKA